jgi:ATP-binding cassette subfamily B protein
MKEVKTLPRYTKAGLLGYFLKGSVLLFVSVVVFSFLVTLTNVIVPKIIGFTIDCVLKDLPVPEKYKGLVALAGGVEYLKANIWVIAVIITAIAALTLVFHYCRMYFNTWANQSLMQRMRNGLFTHIQRLPLEWHNSHNTGDIIQRCTSDADTISNFVSNQILSLFRIVLLLVISVTFMFITDARLAAVALAFVPLLTGYSLFFYFKAGKRFKKCDEEEGVLSTLAQENLTGVRVVRAFGRERYERDKFEKQNTYYTGLWVRLEKFMALYWASSDLIAALQLMLIVVLGSVFCVRGHLTLGSLVEFIAYNTMMIGPVRQLGRIISNLSKAGVALGRIGEIMNAEEEDYGADEGGLSGAIAFENVSFGYEAGKPVLKNISFTVPQGTTLGIIGGTGSGKSTVARLLDRLYEADSGEIYIGERRLRDIPRATLRKYIGLVLQEGYVYSRTVGENIAIACDSAAIADIKNAAAAACVDGNIEGFASGYDTVVGERGVTLSGGQKQRVCIARTLMRKTPYIILDDSLSAVDSDTDAAIRASLAKSFKDCTAIIISHRITTVMHADNIIVMDGGRIAESGTHAQLLRKNGIYKRICDLQTALPEDLKEADNAD